MRLEDVDFGKQYNARIKNCIKNIGGIETLEDTRKIPDEIFLNSPNFSKKSLLRLRERAVELLPEEQGISIERLMSELVLSWGKYGKYAIKKLATERPYDYVRLMSEVFLDKSI